MILQLCEKQAEMKAKKKYRENINQISDLDDICDTIDELIERFEDSNCEFKDKFIQNLKDMKIYTIDEMRHYEEENIEIMEDWEGT